MSLLRNSFFYSKPLHVHILLLLKGIFILFADLFKEQYDQKLNRYNVPYDTVNHP